MGICGTAMASLAGLLHERGFKVTGSDQNVYPPMSTFLESLNIPILKGYKAENLNPRPDFVVVGNVISKHYEEAQALLATDIPYASLPETLRDWVIEDRHSIVVAGTHGKTTTTSMMAWICELENVQPGFLIGGIAKNFSQSFQNPKGNYFIIEGDEYDTAFFAKVPKFNFYKPRSVILNSIEFDHADIYNDLNDVLKAFESLLKLIPKEEGVLVYNAEDQNIVSLLELYGGKKISFGFEKGDWTLGKQSFLREGLEFEVLYKEKLQETLFLPMFGQYNMINALSVYALAKELDFKLDLKQCFANFKGVKRRQELIGEPAGIQVIEDFAHHPTAVKATIESFKKRQGSGDLFVIFEPRSNTSRRKVFQKQYQKALEAADTVCISEPFTGTSQLPPEERLDVESLVKKLIHPKRTLVFTEVEEAIDLVKEYGKSGDTVLIMSNGGFQNIYSKIIESLSS